MEKRRIVKLTVEDINSMVKESINKVTNVLCEEDNSPLQTTNDKPEKEYEAIGFANKFYTLWHVIERKYSKTYIYRKNISFSKEKAFEKYPDAVFDERLNGMSHTFTVRTVTGGSSDDYMEKFSISKKTVNPGQEVHIDRFIVTGISHGKTRYGSMYTSIHGEDVSELDRFIVNIFDNRNDIPSAGDILKLDAKVGFYNNDKDTIYLNDPQWEFVTRKETSDFDVQDGEKIKNQTMVVLQNKRGESYIDGSFKKPGFITLLDENGVMYYIDTYVQAFRSSEGEQKFKDIIDNIYKGTTLIVSGTVKKVDGFNRILRAKLQITENDTQENSSNEDHIIGDKDYFHIIKVVEIKRIGKNTREQDKTREEKIYNIDINKYDEFIDFICNLTQKNEAKLKIGDSSQNVEPNPETVKQIANNSILHFRDCDSVNFYISKEETYEYITYSLNLYEID